MGPWLEDDTFAQLCRFFPPGSRLLEIGCGTGAAALRLAGAGREVVAVDISPAMIAQAQSAAASHPACDGVTWVVAPAASERLAPSGAEDEDYLGCPCLSRAANQPIVELGELLRVRGVDVQVLAKLRGFATALPRRTPVNVNIVPPEVLVAMVPGLTLAEAQALAGTRAAAPFPSLEEFRKRLPKRAFQWEEGDLSVDSQ